jgi:hypothetical protein
MGRSRSLVLALPRFVVLALGIAACSSSSGSESVDAPSCADPNSLVLEGTIDGKSVSQTLPNARRILDQISDPKRLDVTVDNGSVNLRWAGLVANGHTTSLTSAVLRLPGETADRTASSGVLIIGSDDYRASLTFPNGKVGLCVR